MEDFDAKVRRVQTISFFHAVGHGEHAPPKGGDKASKQFSSSEITALVKDLQSRNLLGDKPTLTISPAGQPAAEANAVIGEISIVEQ
jgi:hypothetical protein